MFSPDDWATIFVKGVVAMENNFKVYGYRWVVLGVFMLINITVQFLWICFAPITATAAKFYGVNDLEIGMLAMLFMLVYIPMAIPAAWVIDTFGLYKGVGLGAVLLGIFGILRGIFAANYHIVFACTVGLAIGQPFILNAFTTIAAKWFPLNERATATGLGFVANFIGIAGGLMLTPYLVITYGIATMQMIYGIATAASSIIFLLLARDHPITPPSPPGYAERALMTEGLKQIVRNPYFILLMIMFFIGNGIFNGVATWIENIMRPKGLSITQAGMAGGMLLLGGLIGAAIISVLSDYSRRRRPFMIAGAFGAIPWLLAIIFGHGYWVMLVSAFMLGFFLISLAPVGFQYAAEITFPAPEGTSNGLLQLAAQASVILIWAGGVLSEHTGSFKVALLIGVILITLGCPFMILYLKESSLIRSDAPTGS